MKKSKSKKDKKVDLSPIHLEVTPEILEYLKQPAPTKEEKEKYIKLFLSQIQKYLPASLK